MSRSGRSALIGIVALLALLGGGAWVFRDQLAGLVGRGSEPVVVSPEAAAAAEAKLQGLRDGGDPVQLSSVEASSLLRYRSPAWLSERVSEPSVEFATDIVTVSGTVATSELPSHPELDRVRMLLPDSARIEIKGRVASLAPGRSALEIDQVDFAGIPIPQRYYPDVLARVGRLDEPGLAPDALAITLPPGVGTARVEGGYLLLSR